MDKDNRGYCKCACCNPPMLNGVLLCPNHKGGDEMYPQKKVVKMLKVDLADNKLNSSSEWVNEKKAVSSFYKGRVIDWDIEEGKIEKWCCPVCKKTVLVLAEDKPSF